MRTTVRFLVRRVMLAGSFAFASIVVAQPPQNLLPQPRIASVFPVGAQVGTAVDATLIGTDLDGATQLLFSHPGLTAELPPPPPEPPADPKKKDDKKDDKKKETPKPNKKAPPPPTEAKFKIKVDAKTPPGSYDLRVVNKYGVSNPRTFVVGELPEVVEKEPNNDVTEPQKVAIGTTINGVINSATDVDYSAFVGKANQRVFVQCAASSLDSKLRPLVEVFDTAGKRLAQNRNYADTDALADVTLPKDGEYLVRLTEFAHQSGSGDHFYRLTIRSGPWIDAVHPPAIEPNKPTTVTLYGRNLPGGKLVPDMSVDGRPFETLTQTITPSAAVGELKFTRRVDPPTALQDGFEFKLAGSNSVPIYLANGSVTLEPAADNDTPEKAAAIAPPCEIAGRIDRRYDRDWYRFTAKKGDTYTIDLLADRIGSTIDAFLTIRNATTKQDLANEATLDDNSESLHPTSFFSRNTDPAAHQFVAPADGEYLVLVGSRESNVNYGPRCGYLLRIRPAKPDFRIVVMPRSRENPQAVIAQPSGETAFDVFVHRIDGFAGTVDVKVDGLPNGVTASKCLIASGAKWGTLVLSGGETLKDSEAKLIVTGSATLDGKPLTRTARSASITWGLPGQPNVPSWCDSISK